MKKLIAIIILFSLIALPANAKPSNYNYYNSSNQNHPILNVLKSVLSSYAYPNYYGSQYYPTSQYGNSYGYPSAYPNSYANQYNSVPYGVNQQAYISGFNGPNSLNPAQLLQPGIGNGFNPSQNYYLNNSTSRNFGY